MSTVHPASSDLELYVMGALGPVTAARIEAHVAECGACSAALAREASLEMAFTQIAQAPEPAVRRAAARFSEKRDAAVRAGTMHRRTVTFACALGGALSIAAAWILWVSPVPPDGGSARALGAPTIEVGGDAEGATSGTTASLDARQLSAGLDGG